MKNFTTELVNSFRVGEEFVRIGLAQFSDVFQHEFYLNEFYTEQAIGKHIGGLKQRRGGTKIGLALESILSHFEAVHGSRRSEKISQNLVLITDGDSQDDVEEAGYHLRQLGVEVFAIGIGNVHDLELLQITGTPKKLFTVQNFGSLENIKQKVFDTICKSKPEPQINPGITSFSYLSYIFPTFPCLICNMFPFATDCSIDIAMGFDISQRNPALGETLVSGHTKLESFLPDIANYVSSVKGLCCVNNELIKTNIGYRVVSEDGGSMYDFNFEEYSKDVVTKVMTTAVREPTYFNSALLRSFKEKFRTQSGAGVKVSVAQQIYLQNKTKTILFLFCFVKLYMFAKLMEGHLNLPKKDLRGVPLDSTRVLCSEKCFKGSICAYF